jgi:UDP-4-amino-4,6-dideoxy-N-acetyl-beta-L-altrosamine N-acetyltransferase
VTRAGPLIGLRALSQEDRLQLLTWRNDPGVRRWMYTDHWISHEEHAAWFDLAVVDRSRRYWVIECDGAPVGLANIYGLDAKNGRASWAFYLGEAGMRGKGVGAVVEYRVIEHAFGPLGLNKLWCEVLAENLGVLRLHESFGFQREALFRDHLLKDGTWTDVVGLGLLRSEWEARRAASRARLEALGFGASLDAQAPEPSWAS